MLWIGCGLSLEGVAGVDQEGSPGNGSVKAWFEERLHSISGEGTRTSLGVQRSWRPTGYASVLPMQEVPLQRLVIESISCISCSTEKKISNASTTVIKGFELHSDSKVIPRDM